MAKALGEHKCYTCIHKYYSVEDWKEFAASNKAILPFVAASSGTYKIMDFRVGFGFGFGYNVHTYLEKLGYVPEPTINLLLYDDFLIIGTAEGDFERLCDILENVPEVKFICLDVANGYSQFFVEYVVCNYFLKNKFLFLVPEYKKVS